LGGACVAGLNSGVVDVGADDLFAAGEDLVKAHAGGVEDDGVGCGFEGGLGAVAVAVVAGSHFGEDGGLGDRSDFVLTGSDLAEAASAADFRVSVEEDFHFGVGEDGGADVSAFHDDAALDAESALLEDHPLADERVDGDAGGGGGDVGVTDAAGDVHAVEQDAVAVAGGFEGDFGGFGEGEEGGFFVEVEVGVDGLVGEGAVHGSGFEIQEVETAG
jgi:hypothetical protein